MTMSTSSAPAATASATSASLTGKEARPEGKAVATEATLTGLPARATLAHATRSGYTHTAATGGTLGLSELGLLALPQSALTFPGVSAPSKVVRSTIEIAASIAQSLAPAFIER